MYDLIVVEKLAEWRLKGLVLDSVSSPITRRVYNMALDEFMAWFRLGTTARLHQGDRQRLPSITRGPRPRFVVHHHPDVSYPQAGGRGIRQWVTRS